MQICHKVTEIIFYRDGDITNFDPSVARNGLRLGHQVVSADDDERHNKEQEECTTDM